MNNNLFPINLECDCIEGEMCTRCTDNSAPTPEPARLQPLGPTDSHNFANGVVIYWYEGNAHIHASAGEFPVKVPMNLFPVIVAVCKVMGLTDVQANLIADAAEAERPR